MESNKPNVEFDPEVGYEPDVSNLPIDYPEPIDSKSIDPESEKEKDKDVNHNIRFYPQSDDKAQEDSDLDTENSYLAEYFMPKDYKNTIKEVPKNNVRNAPYQAIVNVTSNFKVKNLIGTAVLVGPNHALTSYSNIHQKDLGDAETVEISSHFKNATAKIKTKFTFGLNVLKTPGLQYYKNTDLVLLILDKKIGDELGFLAMTSLDPKDYIGKEVFLTGILAKGSDPLIQASNQGKLLKSAKAITNGLLVYDMRANFKSLVGCPIYIVEGKKPKIIAIQSYKELKGTLLTKERIDYFTKKIKETTI